MFKQFKTATTIGMMAVALLASASASAQAPAKSPYPSAAPEGSTGTPAPNMGEMFWTEPRMRMMDTNKDGMVSRQEYMDHMGAQYDRMDGPKKGMLTRTQFMDRKMMMMTFPSAAPEDGSSPARKK